MYPVSNAFAIAFNPSLNLDQISILRCFNQTFEQLNDISYLSEEMLKFLDPIIAKQLRDWAEAVYEKKESYSLIEMFSCELKFMTDICKKWINTRFMSKNLKLDLFQNRGLKKQPGLVRGDQMHHL